MSGEKRRRELEEERNEGRRREELKEDTVIMKMSLTVGGPSLAFIHACSFIICIAT